MGKLESYAEIPQGRSKRRQLYDLFYPEKPVSNFNRAIASVAPLLFMLPYIAGAASLHLNDANDNNFGVPQMELGKELRIPPGSYTKPYF
jgi:hypothetical protein